MGYDGKPNGSDFTIVTVVLQYGVFARELDTEHYNGSILHIYKLGVLTTTHLYNNGFLLIVLVYALVNI